jgi:cytochrome c oxidase cbb3-type subunit 4
MEAFFTEAARLMTVVTTLTFLGIVWWAFSKRRQSDFEAAARLPFADDFMDAPAQEEQRHG